MSACAKRPAPTSPSQQATRCAPLLETRGLCRTFGALAAARDIDFRLEAGARHALIGPNGAGKTTFVNLLTGVIPPTSGQVLLKGRDITGVAQAERVKLGIARTFQINRLFRGLSVLENVYLAVAERVGAAPSMFRPAGLRAGRGRRVDASAGDPEARGRTPGTASPSCPTAASAWSSSPSRWA